MIGAAGHIGNAIVRALLRARYDVTACGRRSSPPINLSGLPVVYSPGNADKAGQFEAWIAGQDIVVDAAAPYPLSIFSVVGGSGSEPIFHAERRTRRLLDAVDRHSALFAYVSSFVTLSHPRTEAESLQRQAHRLAHPYFEVKELIESEILRAGRRGIRAVIVNPSYCFGPWDLRDRQLCTIPLLLSGEIPGAISQTLNIVDVRDVAEALLAAMKAQRYSEPIMLGAHSISLKELYGLICDLGGVPRLRLVANAGLTLIGAYWLELTLGAMGRKTMVPVGPMMMARGFDHLPSSGEFEALGIKPRPLRETIADSIKWYREIGYC